MRWVFRVFTYKLRAKTNRHSVREFQITGPICWKGLSPTVLLSILGAWNMWGNREISYPSRMAYEGLPNPPKWPQMFLTDGSKTEEGVAVAAVSTKHVCIPYTCRFLDIRELWTIILAFIHAYHSKQKSFLIFCDSLLSLQAIFNLNYDHWASKDFRTAQ